MIGTELATLLSGVLPWATGGIMIVGAWIVRSHYNQKGRIEKLEEWRKLHVEESKSVHEDIVEMKLAIKEIQTDLKNIIRSLEKNDRL